MSFVAETMVPSIVKMLGKSKAPLARYVRAFLEARRLRIEHDRDFYRNLKAYCRVLPSARTIGKLRPITNLMTIAL